MYIYFYAILATDQSDLTLSSGQANNLSGCLLGWNARGTANILFVFESILVSSFICLFMAPASHHSDVITHIFTVWISFYPVNLELDTNQSLRKYSIPRFSFLSFSMISLNSSMTRYLLPKFSVQHQILQHSNWSSFLLIFYSTIFSKADGFLLAINSCLYQVTKPFSSRIMLFTLTP